MQIKESLAYLGRRLLIYTLPCERNSYRARMFAGNFLMIFFVAAVLLKLSFVLFMAGFQENPFYADITKTALINLANNNRGEYNLPPLIENASLSKAAYLKALDMEKNGYFNHVSPSGISPWHWFDLAGYNYRYAGENLAIGFIESEEVQKAWEASPAHEANIVNGKYQEIGIAVYRARFNGNPATIVVQLFGTRQAQDPAPQTGSDPQLIAATNAANGESETNEIKNAVMGASTINPDNNSATRKMTEFLSEGYFNVIQWLVYGSLALVILLLLLNFALSADFGRPEVLAKALGFVILMAVFALLDRTVIITLIPHNFSIY